MLDQRLILARKLFMDRGNLAALGFRRPLPLVARTATVIIDIAY
jgi:hypothetical protein